jgi:hypothetical protein
MAFRIVHSTNPSLLRTTDPHLTVEAEYGSDVVEGSVFTAAHHQPVGSPFAGDHLVAGGRPAPCNDTSIPVLALHSTVVVGISHIDLDTVGGCARAMPEAQDLFRPSNDGFWRLAAFVDTSGPHKLHLSGAAPEDVLRLQAWWAYAKTLPRLPFNSLNDATEVVLGCLPVLREILADDAARIDAGRAFAAKEASLNMASFVGWHGPVLARKSPSQGDFVNHLYAAPDGVVGRAVVAWNPEAGSITVSLESAIEGVSCRDIVQSLWGPLAGGHAGIAGSPRGQVMTEADFAAALRAVEDSMPA